MVQADPSLFRRPLGLVLSGGGALGAWQAGALKALVDAGVEFDRLLAFSAGALNGAGYAFGRLDWVLDTWTQVSLAGTYRFAPQLKPFSVCSNRCILDSIVYIEGDDWAKPRLEKDLTVVSLCLNDMRPAYATFSRRGQGAWDAPIRSWMTASCAIPFIFPTEEIGGLRYTDGGVPGKEWMRFDVLAGCAEVLVLELITEREVGRRVLPFWWGEQKSREIVRRQIDSGVSSLATLPNGPKVTRVEPSEILDFRMLDFRAKNCIPAIELGRRDAQALMSRRASRVAQG